MILIPKHPNEETRLAAARKTARTLIDEAGVEGDIEEIAADIAKHCQHGDGFQMAKDLESAYWDCDMRIAEVLDNHSHVLDRCHEEFLSRFQEQHAVQPPFPPGAVVRTRRGMGVIDRIDEHRPMTYAVKMDSDAEDDAQTGRRLLLYFDEVKDV